MTCSNKELINGAYGGLPVTYEKKTANKGIINKDELWKADVNTFDNKIGFLTNLSTSSHTLLSNYEVGSSEYEAIVVRLKEMTCQQSKQIDKAKAIRVDPIPEWWSKFQRYKDEDDDETKEKVKFYNSILLEKRPYFFRYLYSHYDREYKKYRDVYNLFCMNQFGLTLDEFLAKERKTEREKKYEHYYYRYNHLLDNDSVMNMVCHHMEKEIQELKNVVNDSKWNFDTEKEKQNKMRLLYKKWKELRKKYGKDEENMIPQIMEMEVLDISTNSKDIAKLSLNCSSGFGLTVFGKHCEQLWKKKMVRVPVPDKDGEIEFDGERYSLVDLKLDENG